MKHISRSTANTLLLSLTLALMAGALHYFPGTFTATLETPPPGFPALMACFLLGWAGYDIAKSAAEERAS